MVAAAARAVVAGAADVASWLIASAFSTSAARSVVGLLISIERILRNSRPSFPLSFRPLLTGHATSPLEAWRSKVRAGACAHRSAA
jgi:hypothetical protein